MHDRIGNAGFLDQLLLRQLRSEVAVLRQTFCADDGQRNMMARTGRLLGCEQVAGRGREEIERRPSLERGAIGYVDDDLRAGQCLGEPLAGDGVDGRLR
jgi:hypothetical protein